MRETQLHQLHRAEKRGLEIDLAMLFHLRVIERQKIGVAMRTVDEDIDAPAFSHRTRNGRLGILQLTRQRYQRYRAAARLADLPGDIVELAQGTAG